jgi:hypothetical protein
MLKKKERKKVRPEFEVISPQQKQPADTSAA